MAGRCAAPTPGMAAAAADDRTTFEWSRAVTGREPNCAPSTGLCVYTGVCVCRVSVFVSESRVVVRGLDRR